MFCRKKQHYKKRSVIQNALAGRLPLRDITLDVNETHVLDSGKPPTATSGNKPVQDTPRTAQNNIDVNNTTEVPSKDNQTPKPTLPILASQDTPHTINTPTCTLPDEQTNSLKTIPSGKRIKIPTTTPASTFPISNPASSYSGRTNLTPSGAVQSQPNGHCIKSSVPQRQLGLAVTAEESSREQTKARPPTFIPPAVSERKGSVSKQDSSVVVMNDRKFKKVCVVGTGGSSKVFKVLSEDFQIYALKEVYVKHVDPMIKEAYVNEIKLLKRLRASQEIITMHNYDYDKVDGVLYLLLDYAEMDLNSVIKNWNKNNHMLNVLYFWNQMLLAVKVIHAEGVVHNDLKPANFVLIGAELKLIDFGISKRIEAEHTSFERDTRCGTSNYMSPETIQIYEGKDCFKVGRPSDVWSLGCILYRMVYGRTPFEHIKGQLNKWNAIVSPTETIHFPHIESKTAIDIMKKCLTRSPKDRPTIDQLILHPYSRNTAAAMS